MKTFYYTVYFQAEDDKDAQRVIEQCKKFEQRLEEEAKLRPKFPPVEVGQYFVEIDPRSHRKVKVLQVDGERVKIQNVESGRITHAKLCRFNRPGVNSYRRVDP